MFTMCILQPMEELNKYLTIKDYMKLYDVSRQTVYNKISDGKIKVKKFLNRTLIEKEQ